MKTVGVHPKNRHEGNYFAILYTSKHFSTWGIIWLFTKEVVSKAYWQLQNIAGCLHTQPKTPVSRGIITIVLWNVLTHLHVFTYLYSFLWQIFFFKFANAR